MNNTQRKMLDGIVQKRFKDLKQELRQTVQANFREEEKKILDKLEKKYARMLKAGRLFYQLQAELKGDLAADGVNVETSNSNPRLSFQNRYYNNPNKEHLDAESRMNAMLAKVDGEVEELRLNIWGSDLSFEELRDVTEEHMKQLEDRYGKKVTE